MSANTGTIITAPIVTPDSGDQFPTFNANDGAGGLHNVALLSDRDAIPAPRLVVGMLCAVAQDGNLYQWNGSAWVNAPTGITQNQADARYRAKSSFPFHQGSPASVWTIVHNLGSMPNVLVQDSAGTTVEGDVAFDLADPMNKLTITFSAAFSGTAYLT